MSTRKSAAAPAAGSGALPSAAAFNDVPRQQMAAAMRASCALFRGFEAMRRIQQKTAHQALSHHQAVAERLSEPCQPLELLALEADVLRFDLQGAAQYWQQLGVVMLEMQRELLAGVSASAQAEGEDASAATAGFAPMPGLPPFFFGLNGGQERARTAH